MKFSLFLSISALNSIILILIFGELYKLIGSGDDFFEPPRNLDSSYSLTVSVFFSFFVVLFSFDFAFLRPVLIIYSSSSCLLTNVGLSASKDSFVALTSSNSFWTLPSLLDIFFISDDAREGESSSSPCDYRRTVYRRACPSASLA